MKKDIICSGIRMNIMILITIKEIIMKKRKLKRNNSVNIKKECLQNHNNVSVVIFIKYNQWEFLGLYLILNYGY